jgi:hypothetical protein
LLVSVIPATLQVEVRGQQGTVAVQGKSEIPSQKMAWAWWPMSVTPAMWEAQIGGLWSEASPGQKCKTLSEK